MPKCRLAVLISGNGSNLQAIIDACNNKKINAEIVIVATNREKAFGIKRAQIANIPTIYCHLEKNMERILYDKLLYELIKPYHPDLIALAGWMRKFSSSFLQNYPGAVINIHPALPNTFPGMHAIERSFDAFQQGMISQSGVMIHYVPDEGIDNGPVILQESVNIFSTDTLQSFEERIHQTEHRLYIEALSMLCN